MKKSSLGKKSISTFSTVRKSDNEKKGSGLPGLVRSTSTSCLRPPRPVELRHRDFSADRISNVRDPFLDRTSAMSETSRTPRPMSGRGRPSSVSTKKGDLRPLQDKEWQNEALLTVIACLGLDHDGYQLCEAYKPFKPLTLSAFIDVCNYLIQKLVGKAEINKFNYLTELPYILKKLNYKGKVDKMMLQTVNTPHNFPVALGVFQFLAELLLASRSFSEKFLDIAFNDFRELETSQTDDLKYKHFVPVLKHMWSRADSIDTPTAELIERNKDIVDQALALSGFSIEDGALAESEAQAEYDETVKEIKEANERLIKINQQIKDTIAEVDSLDEKLCQNSTDTDKLKHQRLEIDKNKQGVEDEIKHLEDQLSLEESMIELLKSNHEVTIGCEDDLTSEEESLTDKINEARICLLMQEKELINQCAATSSLKHEVHKLWNEYSKKVLEVVTIDASVLGALGDMFPRAGETPCDEATAAHLDRILVGLKERFAQMKDVPLEEAAETHRINLKELETMISSLKNNLAVLSNEEEKWIQELEATGEELKENYHLFIEKEEQFELESDDLRKYYDGLQRMLDVREEVVKKYDDARVNEMNKMLAQFTQISEVLDEFKSNFCR